MHVSMPADGWLTPEQNEMKWGVVERIEQLGYTPEIFTDPSGRKSLSSDLAWSAADADEIARHCHGAAIIGLPRWVFETEEGRVHLPTEYCHYEGDSENARSSPADPRSAQPPAARRVRLAFLFTKDDELQDASGKQQAAPRDNVVFEAGYFASAKPDHSRPFAHRHVRTVHTTAQRWYSARAVA